MKNIFALALMFLMVTVMNAQADDSKPYPAHNEGWITNLDEAYKLSKESGKPIMANFTGSDWCGWCIRLTKNVFVHDEFKEWAEDNVVLLELDFPKRKKLPQALAEQNRGLKNAFGIRGFPTIWVFDLDKNNENNQYNISALGSTGYSDSVKKFTGDVDDMIERRNSGE